MNFFSIMRNAVASSVVGMTVLVCDGIYDNPYGIANNRLRQTIKATLARWACRTATTTEATAVGTCAAAMTIHNLTIIK